MAQLFAQPFYTALDSNGDAISGATLTFYVTGTTTLSSVYANSTLATPLSNPVTADSAGRFAAIYLDPTVTYRVILKDGSGNTIKDVDPVSLSASGLTFLQSGAGAAGRSVQDKLREWVSVKDFGATGDGTTDDTAAVQAAIDYAMANSRSVLVPPGDYSVTGLTAVLTAGADTCSFTMHGQSRNGARFTKRDSSTDPILAVSHTTEPTTANVDIQNLAFFGNAKGSDGVRLTSIGSATLSRLWVRNCDNGINFVGVICSEVENTYIAGCNTGAKLRANSSLSAYSNANTFLSCRIGDNTTFGIDFGQGSLLRLRDCDLEQNGTAADTTTGGLMIRSSVFSEIGYAIVIIDGTWFEGNRGWTIQCEALGSTAVAMSVANTNFLTSESGRAFYVGAGGLFTFDNVMMPSSGDTLNATCTKLTIKNSVINTLAGTQGDLLIENTVIGSAPVEGTHQRDLHVGGGAGIRLSWASGTGEYKLATDPATGDAVFVSVTGGTGVLKSGAHLNLDGKELRVSGQKVVGARQAAIADDASGATNQATVNAILAALRTHGLIAT